MNEQPKHPQIAAQELVQRLGGDKTPADKVTESLTKPAGPRETELRNNERRLPRTP